MPIDDQVAAARREVVGSHAARLAVGRELQQLGADLGNEWPGRKADSERGEDALVAIIVARSLTTGWAAYELACSGFGGQAQMLNRSLFEDMVDAHWVTVAPALAGERYRDHFDHSRMLFVDALRAQGDDDGVELPEFDPVERKRLDGLFGPYGDKSWTGQNLRVRVDAIEHLWTEERRTELHRLRRFAVRDNNQTLHLSARGMDALLIEDTTGLRIRTGPRPERLIEATLGIWFLLLETLSLSLDHFEVQGEHRRRLEGSARRSWVFRTPSAQIPNSTDAGVDHRVRRSGGTPTASLRAVARVAVSASTRGA